MTVRKIKVELNDLGGLVEFETDLGSFDTSFVVSPTHIIFGNGVDDAQLTNAEVEVIAEAIEQAITN